MERGVVIIKCSLPYSSKCQMLGVLNVFSLSLSLSPFLSLHCDQSQALKNSVLYVLLAPYDNEQSDLLQRVWNERRLEEIPAYR